MDALAIATLLVLVMWIALIEAIAIFYREIQRLTAEVGRERDRIARIEGSVRRAGEELKAVSAKKNG